MAITLFCYFLICVLVSASLRTGDRTIKHNNYEIYDVEDNCEQNYTYSYELSDMSMSSAAKFEAYGSDNDNKTWSCNFTITPPNGYGVILNIEYLKLGESNAYGNCTSSYMKIFGNGLSTREYCGRRTTTLYTSSGSIHLYFSGPYLLKNEGFNFIATAFKRGCSHQDPRFFMCSYGRCIWKGLFKDQVNNCGDNSDEVDVETRTEVITRRPNLITTTPYSSSYSHSRLMPFIYISIAICVVLFLGGIITAYSRFKTPPIPLSIQSANEQQEPSHETCPTEIHVEQVHLVNVNVQPNIYYYQPSEIANVGQLQESPPSYYDIVKPNCKNV